MKIARLVICCLTFAFYGANSSASDDVGTTANPHVIGWTNLLIPGSGKILQGEITEGLIQTGYETGTFLGGYQLSGDKSFSSLDGISDSFKPFSSSQRLRNAQVSVDQKMFSNILLEFSIKAHMTNTFMDYRDAYKNEGITEGLDQHTALDTFSIPFQKEYLLESDVWIPLALVASAVVVDFVTTTTSAIQPLTPQSNLLYDFNYGLWQPLGSGYPEEAFFRGFLQHEVKTATDSPALGVLAQTIAFAFSHEPGNGRYSAALVGGYLGYLTEKHHGDLGPSSALHFWGDLLLGIETALLSHKAQKTTSQAGFTYQYNF